MKAMVLAAGLGSRMGNLSNRTPKPLLPVAKRTLIEHQLDRLRAAGYRNVVVNTSHLGDMIRDRLQDHPSNIRFSHERKPLETAGAVLKVLPYLGSQFLVINSDIWCDHGLSVPKLGCATAHLVMVDNPKHNSYGDFCLRGDRLMLEGGHRLTYSGIGWFRREFFSGLSTGKRALGPLLRAAIRTGKVSGQYYNGTWVDVGTPERLKFVRSLVE